MMNYFVVTLLSAMFALSHSTFASVGDATYQLGSGDIISIQVYGEEELSFDEILLTDAATISFPFLGEVGAKDKTAQNLESLIIQGLKNGYLINPKVTVSIIEYRAFFVNGEVEEPGGYPFQPGLTLRKAIAISGGLTERASKTKIFVIRDKDADKRSHKIGMDSSVNPGDIVTIEQSFF